MPQERRIIRDDFIEERVCIIMADNLMTEAEALKCAYVWFEKYRVDNKLFLNNQPKII